MKEKRLLMEQETFLLHSQIIIQKVQQHSYYKKAKTIGIYVSLPGEVNTFPLIQQAHIHLCLFYQLFDMKKQDLAYIPNIPLQNIYHEEGLYQAIDDSYYQRRMKEVSQNGIISKVSVASLLHLPFFQPIFPTIPIRYKHLSSVSGSIAKKIANYGVNHVMVELSIEPYQNQ